MTDRRELETLAAKMRTLGASVTLNEDGDGWIKTVTIEMAGETDTWKNHALTPIGAAEAMRAILAKPEYQAELIRAGAGDPAVMIEIIVTRGDARQFAEFIEQAKAVGALPATIDAMEIRRAAIYRDDFRAWLKAEIERAEMIATMQRQTRELCAFLKIEQCETCAASLGAIVKSLKGKGKTNAYLTAVKLEMTARELGC